MPKTQAVKNTLMSVNNILFKLSQSLSFGGTGINNVVHTTVRVSPNAFHSSDVVYATSLLRYFLAHTDMPNGALIKYEHNDNNAPVISIKVHKNEADKLPGLFKKHHEGLADALLDPRALPENHFSYQYMKIRQPANETIEGFDNAMTALFAAALPFNVSVSCTPVLRISNENRTQGLLSAHKNNFLLLHPDYAFTPEYLGNPDDIQINHEEPESKACSSIVTRQYMGLQPGIKKEMSMPAIIPQKKF